MSEVILLIVKPPEGWQVPSVTIHDVGRDVIEYLDVGELCADGSFCRLATPADIPADLAAEALFGENAADLLDAVAETCSMYADNRAEEVRKWQGARYAKTDPPLPDDIHELLNRELEEDLKEDADDAKAARSEADRIHEAVRRTSEAQAARAAQEPQQKAGEP